MAPFATLEDVNILWRTVKDGEKDKVVALLDIVSDSLRVEAKKVNKDLDAMVAADPHLCSVAKSVTVDVVARGMMTATDSEPMTQMSQSGMGSSFSGTYLVPGGGLFIKKSELARLGLKRQRIGGIDYA